MADVNPKLAKTKSTAEPYGYTRSYYFAVKWLRR